MAAFCKRDGWGAGVVGEAEVLLARRVYDGRRLKKVIIFGKKEGLLTVNETANKWSRASTTRTEMKTDRLLHGFYRLSGGFEDNCGFWQTWFWGWPCHGDNYSSVKRSMLGVGPGERNCCLLVSGKGWILSGSPATTQWLLSQWIIHCNYPLDNPLGQQSLCRGTDCLLCFELAQTVQRSTVILVLHSAALSTNIIRGERCESMGGI